MPRRAGEPRKDGSGQGQPGRPGRSEVGPNRRGATTPGDALRGLRSGLADLARMTADRAERAARNAARKAGMSAREVDREGRHARAEAHRDTPNKSGVGVPPARRWATGKQKPSPRAERTGRTKVQRAMGGAKAVKAERVRQTSSIDVGTVTVRVSSGGKGGYETRNLGYIQPDPAAMEAIAALIESGHPERAEELLGQALLEAYGDGLSDFMQIVDIPDPTIWM